MAISFNQIPSNIRVPGAYTEVDNSNANSGLPQFNNRFIVFGQRLSGGSVAAGVLTQVAGSDQADAYFGRGSLLARTIRTLKLNDQFTETWAVALDDNGAGVSATGTITVTGPATAAGTINLYLAGQRVQVAVAAADIANTVAASINAAINAAGDLQVTSTVSTNVVTLTARNKGLCGNDIDLRVNYYEVQGGETTPAGLTLALVQLSGGTGNPSIATAIAALPSDIFDYWVNPWTDTSSLNTLEAELNSRFGPLRQLEGFAFTGFRGTSAALSTFGAARNNPHVATIGYNNSPTPPWEWAAAVAGQVGPSASIDPARGYEGLALVGVLAPPAASQFSQTEQNTLLFDGVSTFTVDRSGAVQLQRVITNYQSNPSGAQDVSYLDATTRFTLSYQRQSLNTRLRSKYRRFKLADNGNVFGAGQAVVTPNDIAGEIVALAALWVEAGIIENLEQFKRDLICERSINDRNRVNYRIAPNLVNQLLVLAGQIQFIL